MGIKFVCSGIFFALVGIYCINICQLSSQSFYPDVLSLVFMILGAIFVIIGAFGDK